MMTMINLIKRMWGRKPEQRRPRPEPRYISWYVAPMSSPEQREYLCACSDSEGYYYSRFIAQAHLFNSYAEAKAVTPTYDGSSGITERAGVSKV
jgi:hypothetical protein